MAACEIKGQLQELGSPGPLTLAAALLDRGMPETLLRWTEEHPSVRRPFSARRSVFCGARTGGCF